jgi:hypothetical protein
MTISAVLPEAVEPKKKRNLKYAFTSATVASMASIVLGYGTQDNHFRFVHVMSGIYQV